MVALKMAKGMTRAIMFRTVSFVFGRNFPINLFGRGKRLVNPACLVREGLTTS